MLKRRLLVLTARFPYPALGGDRARILHVCKGLQSRFHLTLLSLCNCEQELNYESQDGLFECIHRVYLPPWKSWMNVLRALPSARPLQNAYCESQEFRETARALLKEHDAVLAHGMETGQYALGAPIPRLLELSGTTPAYAAGSEGSWLRPQWKSLVSSVEHKRARAYHANLIRQFDRIWVQSDEERSDLDPRRATPIEVIPDGADLRSLPYRPPADAGHTILLIANMARARNQRACLWFIENVLPAIRAQAPITLRIIGPAPARMRRRLARCEGVETTGYVDRIADQLAGAFCAVCPAQFAAGMQSNVLEYLSLGLPCVTSLPGLRGLDASPGKDLLVYRTAQEAAAQILMLHGNAAFRLRLAWAGRQLVCRRYDWESIHHAITESAIHAGERHPAWRLSRDRHRPAA